jgi:hypothetical protein
VGAVRADPVDVVQRGCCHLDQIFTVARYRLRELLPPGDLVVDYLWGRPTEILLSAIDRGDAHLGSERVRLLQVGEMAGSSISLPGSVLRSAGLEVLGMGTGTMPPPDVIRRMLAELLDLLASKKLHIDIERVPLSAVGEVWTRDQQGRRPVFIP